MTDATAIRHSGDRFRDEAPTIPKIMERVIATHRELAGVGL